MDQFSVDFSRRQQQIPPQIRPPWDENWKLDEEFFKGLADWDNKHPNSPFLRVVERIKDAAITCKPLQELVPDSPFPARSLVQAFSYFLQLGVVCSNYLSWSWFTI